jgi:hypothetical protein
MSESKPNDVSVDTAALEQLPQSADGDAPANLDAEQCFGTCGLTCWTRTCGRTCGITG